MCRKQDEVNERECMWIGGRIVENRFWYIVVEIIIIYYFTRYYSASIL
jgi:hypothetical protein